MKYLVKAVYKVKKEMEVEVARGSDPMDPSNWGDITSELDVDCWLYDVEAADAAKEGA